MQDLRHEVVNLSSPPVKLISGDNPIFAERAEFVQPVDRWGIYYYQHDNAVTINTRTYPLQVNDVAVVPPGARVSHALAGDDTMINFILFDMPGTGSPRAAMPHIVRDARAAREDWVRAGQRMMDGMTYLVAFTWNFMCAHAVGLHHLRGEAFLYDAEEWIRRNLERRFSVGELSEAVGVSPRHLLRAFRAEHGVTVQEYVIQRRVQEAARLLINTELEPKRVAAKVGIPDLQHFNKLMRQHTGAAPRAFREGSAKR